MLYKQQSKKKPHNNVLFLFIKGLIGTSHAVCIVLYYFPIMHKKETIVSNDKEL